MTEITTPKPTKEFTLHGRLVTAGDTILVTNSPGRHDGFEARVVEALRVAGVVTAVTVWGGKGKGRESMRTFFPDRIAFPKKVAPPRPKKTRGVA